jgi:hypothetical protein
MDWGGLHAVCDSARGGEVVRRILRDRVGDRREKPQSGG